MKSNVNAKRELRNVTKISKPNAECDPNFRFVSTQFDAMSRLRHMAMLFKQLFFLKPPSVFEALDEEAGTVGVSEYARQVSRPKYKNVKISNAKRGKKSQMHAILMRIELQMQISAKCQRQRCSRKCQCCNAMHACCLGFRNEIRRGLWNGSLRQSPNEGGVWRPSGYVNSQMLTQMHNCYMHKCTNAQNSKCTIANCQCQLRQRTIAKCTCAQSQKPSEAPISKSVAAFVCCSGN